jgi:phosphohistidine swiveling domain-containing protein
VWVVPLVPGAAPPPGPEARATAPSPAEVGGKGAGLARLHAAGFRVPTAYAVTTAAYRHTLSGALRGLDTPEAMAQAARRAPIPVEIERAVRDAHAALFGDAPVAVRSSGASEDGERASFAGQLDSVLDVRGADAVLDALRAVWASFFGRANLLYRGRASLDEPPCLVAVVVQAMIAPRIAGVMFTADPVAGDPDQRVISATAGLGEAVVGGRCAETAYVDGRTGQVRRHVPANPGAALVLDGATVAELTRAATRIEAAFGAPQDVEWARDEAGLAFLQARPITAGAAALGDGPAVWSNVNVGEALPGVGTPMTWSIIRGFSRRGFEKAFAALGLSVPAEYELVGSFRGRVYLNLTQFASIVSAIPFMAIGDFLDLGGGADTEEVERWGYRRRSKLGFMARLPISVSRMAVSQVATPARARRWARQLRQRRDRFYREPLGAKGRTELLAELAEIDALFDRTGVIMLAAGSNFLSSYMATRILLRRWGGDAAAEREQHLFSGLSGLVSAEPGLRLLEMARSVRATPALEALVAGHDSAEVLRRLGESAAGRALRAQLDAFLDEYGHRAVREAELSTPRWRETPEFLVDVVRAHLEAPYLPASDELAREGEQARCDYTELIRQHFRPGLGLAFRRVLEHTQGNARLREELRSGVTDTLAMYRRFFLEVGARLVEARAIAHADDVFFLTRDEVERWLRSGRGAAEMALAVATRRAEYVAFGEAPPPPDSFVLNAGDAAIPQARPALGPDTPYLDGLPASPGRVTGRARVLRDPGGAGGDAERLRPGEVLVAPFTDVGWTPLFLVAAAVVTDLGGPLSHSSVVAREYGIPAVANTKEATALIATGDLVTVDGDAGRVYLRATRGGAGSAGAGADGISDP